MKTLTLTTVVVGTLLAANGAAAESRHFDERGANKATHGKFQDRRDSTHRKHRNAKNDVLRLDIPLRLRGDQRIGLKRQLIRHYNINPNDYRLRKVVVNNHNKRNARARLKVGGQVVERVRLHRGKNHLQAAGRTNVRQSTGHWVLELTNARVDNIRLVLEPRRHRVGHVRPHAGPGAYAKPAKRRALTANEPRRWFKGVIHF